MSEATANEGTEKKVEKKKGPVALPHEKKATKSPWTLEKCLKTARRFKSEVEWAKGCSSAYKSAQAHGWLAQCTAGMKDQKSNRKTA